MAFQAPNYTQTPNDFFDEVAMTLKEGELRVLLVIMRQTFGWRKKWDRISLSQLQQKTGMRRNAVNNSLKSLIEKGLVGKKKEGVKGEQKCWYCLIVDEPKEDEEPPAEEGNNDNSNNCYQSPKETTPSLLKRPTKETLTKEKKKNKQKDATSPDGYALCCFLFEEIKKKKPDFIGKITPSWQREAERLLKHRGLQCLEGIIRFMVNDEFFGQWTFSMGKVTRHINSAEEKMKATQGKNGVQILPQETEQFKKNKQLAEYVEKCYNSQKGEEMYDKIKVYDNYLAIYLPGNSVAPLSFVDKNFENNLRFYCKEVGIQLKDI